MSYIVTNTSSSGWCSLKSVHKEHDLSPSTAKYIALYVHNTVGQYLCPLCLHLVWYLEMMHQHTVAKRSVVQTILIDKHLMKF